MQLTPTEDRMLRVLSDGRAHTPTELHKCLVDELGPVSNVQVHLSSLRKKLRPSGQDIMNGAGAYRLVRYIRSDE